MTLYSLNHGRISSKWYVLCLVWVILVLRLKIGVVEEIAAGRES